MRLSLLVCAALAALARAQSDAPASSAPSAAQADTAPTPTAAVLFPTASASWAHNGTAYLKYSLPNGVSPDSITYVLANDQGLLKTGNSGIDEFKSYFVYQKMIRSTAQPAGTGTYWIKWMPAYGENPEDVRPGTGYTVGVAYRLGDTNDASQPHQFAWSARFEIRADGADALPADVSAYPSNATASNWNPPNGPTQASLVGAAHRLSPFVVGVGAGVLVAVAVL
ncbi:hypothetical protein CspeluHIS016_0402700 [Cutaneotrichosporon spelunceum]|uniref:Uncharacterized protein n=1 Tax=Cutaneotrichosporon spelunceum TaxID=1672016 RepID=A0AAD3TVQ6_9TREE|nr:hypothetical protein CspeluHIS016_0402700 [Cutaneotrichosporon spelunceum]